MITTRKAPSARPHPCTRLFVLCLLISVALFGCSKEPQAPLRLGTNVWIGYEPLYLARDLGYLQGTSTKLVEYTSASAVIRSFQNGSIDAAALTFDEAVLLVAHGAEIEAVLVMDVSHGADVILAQPEITHVKELQGRRVGFESTGLGAYLLTRALQQAGMKAADIQPVSIEFADHVSSFATGRIDAIVTYEPTRTKLLAQGARQIFDSSQIPGEIVDLLVVRRDFAQRHPEEVKMLLKNWFRALDYINGHEFHAAKLMALREQLTTREFLTAQKDLRFPDLEENHGMLGGTAPTLLTIGQRLTSVMMEEQLLPVAPQIKPLLTDKYLGIITAPQESMILL